jgi:hypothetical protein
LQRPMPPQHWRLESSDCGPLHNAVLMMEA